MKIVFKSEYVLLVRGETPEIIRQTNGTEFKKVINSRGLCVIPAGEYEAERIRQPDGYDCNWIVLKGTRIGAAEGSLSEWTGAAWGENEVIIYEDDGTKFLNPHCREYTLAQQLAKIVVKRITDPDVICKHFTKLAKYEEGEVLGFHPVTHALIVYNSQKFMSNTLTLVEQFRELLPHERERIEKQEENVSHN